METRLFPELGPRKVLALVLLLCGFSPVWAAEVYQVSEDQAQWIITQDKERPWGIGDPVQVKRGDAILGVGVVEAANDQAGLVNVQRRSATAVAAGDAVEYARDSSQVLEVVHEGTDFKISHPVTYSWYVGDSVCVAHGDLIVGCGKITEVAREHATLQLAGATAWVAPGDFVRSASLETSVLAVHVPSNSIQIRQGIYEKWKEGDRACAMTGGKESACGTIVQTNHVAAAFRADHTVEGILIGSWARGVPHTSFVYQIAEDQSAMVVTNNATPWNQGDAVCAQRHGYEIACGKVIQSNAVAAIVEIRNKADTPTVVGDIVRTAGSGKPDALKEKPAVAEASPQKELVAAASPAPSPPPEAEREPASLSEVAQVVGPPRIGSLMAGVNYVFPNVRYEQSLTQHWAVGAGILLIAYPTGGGTLKGTGFGGNLSYYDAGWFRGLWIFGGGSILNVTAAMNGVEESIRSIVFTAGSGWRWQWDNGTNLGFGVGLNYLTKVNTPAVPLDTANLVPSVLLDFGFSF